jgi:predicted ATPase/DNA-binding CsgD family transcriptional regulator
MVGAGFLIGRERELADVERMLVCARVVTLTGAGGCGKTRLSLELAERASSSAQQVPAVVIDVASVGSAEQLVDAALRAVGARERFGRRPLQMLLEHLADRRLLLVLDNCEHVLAAVGAVVPELLGGVPGLRVLVTSREPLGIDGEEVFRLGALALPELGGGVGAVVRSDAGRLFVDRAAAVDAGFALTPAVARAVARICHQVDGLPLALCLAAARIGALSASEVADGLTRRGRLETVAAEGESGRHRSVRASFDWSYQLLEGAERGLLRRLSVFVGGFTVTAAQTVAAPALGEVEVRRLLESLEAKGLIMAVTARGPERWTFLQTVREQAAEQLRLESEEDEAEDRHLAFFRAFASAADDLVLETGGHELIDAETANLRRALERAVERDIDSATDIVADLMHHWVLAEHFEEGRAACAAALATAPGTDRGGRAVVHCGAGMIEMLSEDYAGAIANTYAGLALVDGVEDVEAQARCLRMSAIVLTQTGIDIELGRRNAHRAADLARCSSDWLGAAWALSNVAVVEATSDRFDAARAAYDEFLTIPNASEHLRLRTFAEVAAAWTEVITGSPERALAHADLALALEGDWPSMTHFQVAGFRIHALALLGRTDEALSEGAREMNRAHESGALQAVPAIDLALVIAELVADDLDGAAARAGRLLEVPQLHTLAVAREVLGRIALARDDAGGVEAQARELDAVSKQSSSARHGAIAQFLYGCAAMLSGDLDHARNLLHATLATVAELGLEREAVDALHSLALLAARTGDTRRAARLAAAAEAERARLGCVALRSTLQGLEAARARSVGRDGQAAWDAAWAEGEQLSLAEAIAYARRRRGRRGRPSAGWGSLTPAELDVATLAAGGLSNPQIATRLFVSRATVKMHLSSVYLKLGVANRTELAARMATHASSSPSPSTGTNRPLRT